MTRFDLELFGALNEEYASTPLVRRPRSLELDGLAEAARTRLTGVEQAGVPLRGRRVLEVGCGAGALSRVLAEEYDCDVVGLDIVSKPSWETLRGPRVDLRVLDISTEDSSALGQFDAIVSFVVLEHVAHPYAMLTAVERLLRPGGRAHLSANLYRGPMASHRYREVFFPWPHLLFPEHVFTEFYEQVHGRRGVRPSWVNKMTHAHYEMYLSRIGFTRHATRLSPSKFDEAFYERFENVLSRYPRYDLSHDFIYLTLGPAGDRETAVDPAVRLAALEVRNRQLEAELSSVRVEAQRQVIALANAVRSGRRRLTAPLRRRLAAVRSASRR
jgi:cyclopropane fatty-acyl-phospholipid synthase-like methyltransferase